MAAHPAQPAYPYSGRGTAYGATPTYQGPSGRGTPYGISATGMNLLPATDMAVAAADMGHRAATDLGRAAYDMSHAGFSMGHAGYDMGHAGDKGRAAYDMGRAGYDMGRANASVGPAVRAPVAPPAQYVPPEKVCEEDEDEAEELFLAPLKPVEPVGPHPILVLAIAVITIGGVTALVFYAISRNDLELTSPPSPVATRVELTHASTNPTPVFPETAQYMKENAQQDVTALPELDGTDEHDATSDAAPTLDS